MRKMGVNALSIGMKRRRVGQLLGGSESFWHPIEYFRVSQDSYNA